MRYCFNKFNLIAHYFFFSSQANISQKNQSQLDFQEVLTADWYILSHTKTISFKYLIFSSSVIKSSLFLFAVGNMWGLRTAELKGHISK